MEGTIFKKKLGFTLIELLLVIAIMGALVVILLPQFSRFNKDQILQDAASSLQGNLRKAQNNATSGTKCNSDTPAANWRIKFSNSASYNLETTCNEPAAVPVLRTAYSFPENIRIAQIAFDNADCYVSGESIDNFAINFNNISGKVSFESTGCVNSNYTQMEIVLELNSDPNQRMSVVAEKGGSIYISSSVAN